jgi:protoporphyrinogen IX oxidase
MSAVHGLYARWRKIFERDGNTCTANFYRFWNEVPTILLLIIVAMAVAKPFSAGRV